MVAGFIIGGIIIIYTAFIIYRKVKDTKAGKSCCGGCDGCSMKGNCGSK
ncbi:MAG TPA: FeoB-associated Cys-rich membrane protein [Mobilitalea sp.]|nr:FeoB-associated Cys-rich membrane protein [Mobilitalea sp.]